eukprot:6205808-Pleurochrysis_carterae.AAC.3
MPGNISEKQALKYLSGGSTSGRARSSIGLRPRAVSPSARVGVGGRALVALEVGRIVATTRDASRLGPAAPAPQRMRRRGSLFRRTSTLSLARLAPAMSFTN